MNIAKLADVVWKIVGLGMAILFLLGVLAAFASIGYGIYQYQRYHVGGIAVDNPDNTRSHKSGLQLTPQYGTPLPLDDSEYWIVPVKLEKKDTAEKEELLARRSVSSESNYGGGYDSESYGSYGNYGPFYNLVFLPKNPGGSPRLLVERKAFIHRVYFPELRWHDKKPAVTPTFLLLEMATLDTNHDKVINWKDASAGYIAALDGAHLTQITPSHTKMDTWSYDAQAHRLFIEVTQDLNGNQKFNGDDPKSILSVNVLAPGMGQEVIPSEIKKKTESILLQ